ncbi:hypothetical protein J6590_063686 [Homalodisca vitripennis]|nr:hypothetical protein J6590_063686 [Homalodisca vitripennis]
MPKCCSSGEVKPLRPRRAAPRRLLPDSSDVCRPRARWRGHWALATRRVVRDIDITTYRTLSEVYVSGRDRDITAVSTGNRDQTANHMGMGITAFILETDFEKTGGIVNLHPSVKSDYLMYPFRNANIYVGELDIDVVCHIGMECFDKKFACIH